MGRDVPPKPSKPDSAQIKKKKFILLHCLRQETLFYDPEPFRFAYIDIMEPREDKGDREGIPHTHSIP